MAAVHDEALVLEVELRLRAQLAPEVLRRVCGSMELYLLKVWGVNQVFYSASYVRMDGLLT